MADSTETIARGAFKRTLSQNPDVALRIDHVGLPLTRTTNGTLDLSEDARGLKVAAHLDLDRPAAREVAGAVKRGDVNEMSFCFRVPSGGDKWNNSRTKRTIHEIDLTRGDVSVVSAGANPNTAVSIRSRGTASRRSLYVPYSYVEEAKYRKHMRARRDAPGSNASVDGEEDKPRYTDAEVEALGKRGVALKRKSGGWHYPITDRRDLLNAIKAWNLGRYAPSEKNEVKAFIKARAIVMRFESLLPASWQRANPKPIAARRTDGDDLRGGVSSF